MKIDRLGLGLIAVTLLVMAFIGGVGHQYRNRLHQEKIQTLGQALTRALSTTDYEWLSEEMTGKRLLTRMVSAQGNQDFAYGVVVNPDGRTRYSVGPISVVPLIELPTEPHAWFGERKVELTVPDRNDLEFHAPLMQNGSLRGFVRIGYFAIPGGGWLGELSDLAKMIFPVAVLMVVSYLIGRYQLRLLGRLSGRISETTRSIGPVPLLNVQGANISDFMQHFEQFIDVVQAWIRQTLNASVAAQTATHMLTYKQEKAESVLHAIPDGILVVDEDCVPSFANARAEFILGTKLDQIIGHQARDWCLNAEVLAFLMRSRNGPASLSLSSMTYAPDQNQERRICVTALPLFSPRDRSTLFGRLILMRDMTAEYLARQAGTEFVSHVSHELKTPLNTLAVYSELLLDYTSLDELELVNAVNVIHEEASRMANLVSNLLNISKLDAGTLQVARKRVKIHDLLQDAYNSAVAIAEKQGVSLKLQIPLDLGSARLDKALLRIAIDNLLGNAIKYSNSGDVVTMSAEFRDTNEIHIDISDTGIGITQEDIAYIFDKYFRADNAQTVSRSGHGLGLYLAKQIIELHQGSLSVESELGKGTTMSITLRAQPMTLEDGRH